MIFEAMKSSVQLEISRHILPKLAVSIKESYSELAYDAVVLVFRKNVMRLIVDVPCKVEDAFKKNGFL